jgi:flavin-dependent dehydrogenase
MALQILRTDVLIAGGGPAGLAAAIALRAHGLQVVVADPVRPPVDKACGEGLLPGTVASLRALGVTLSAEHAVPFRGIRFVGEGQVAQGNFPRSHGLGVRRTVLHQALVERAVSSGVQFLWETRALRFVAGVVHFDSAEVFCRWLIGADGHGSIVRKWAGLDRGRPRRIRYAFRQHFRVSPWTDLVEVHWGKSCQLVVTPVGREEVCLSLTSRSPQLRLKQALDYFPEIASRLKGSASVSRQRGAISTLRILRIVCRGQCALIGDASGSVDSLTGEGLGLAFRQAAALAQALAANDLERYAAAHRRINRPHEIMSRILLALADRRWLRRRVLNALATVPSTFDRLLARRAGTSSSVTLGFDHAFRLCWRLLAPSN